MAINKNLIVAAAALGAVILAMRGRGKNASNKRAALMNYAKGDGDRALFSKLTNSELEVVYEVIAKGNTSNIIKQKYEAIIDKYLIKI